MSISINISSTFSLLSENSLWEKKNYVINFEDYGNLFPISKNSPLRFFYFISDKIYFRVFTL